MTIDPMDALAALRDQVPTNGFPIALRETIGRLHAAGITRAGLSRIVRQVGGTPSTALAAEAEWDRLERLRREGPTHA